MKHIEESASLVAYFAAAAPVCVIVRSHPDNYSQLIVWETETDHFDAGQWMRGQVEYASLSSDGGFMALGVKNARSRAEWAYNDISIICRPPYFTGLEIWLGKLHQNSLAFLPGDLIARPTGDCKHIVNATNECPFYEYAGTDDFDRNGKNLDSRLEPAFGRDQRGRQISLAKGQVFDVSGPVTTVLFDANNFSPTRVLTPDWAKNW